MSNSRLSTLPLGAIRVLDAVARLASAKAAASELSVTPAAISHQIKTLEIYLGTALFERQHRVLKLTPAGERLAQAARDALGALTRTLDDLAAEGLIGDQSTLSVSVVPSFASKWLAPRLDAFQEKHPTIELRVRADEALSDPAVDRRIDVSIRYGAGPYSDTLCAQQLWPTGVVFPVCAPTLMNRHSSPADFLDQKLLRTASPPLPPGSTPICWASWFKSAGLEDSRIATAIARAPLFGTSQLALEAAIAGHGVALSPGILVFDDLNAGRLMRPSTTQLADPFFYWLLYRRDRSDEVRIRAFAGWLKNSAAASILL